jgi:hypothetical protein
MSKFHPFFRLLLAIASLALTPQARAAAPQLFSATVTPNAVDVSFTAQDVTATLRVTALDGLQSAERL